MLALTLAVLILAACGGDDEPSSQAPPPAEGVSEADARGLLRSDGEPRLETVAEGLEAPWDLAFLPDGRALVTERPGRVRLLSANGRLDPEPLAEIDVAAIGEGGLLGVAVDPEFESNSFVYLYRTTEAGNQVVRYLFDGQGLQEDRVLVDGIQAGAIHDGGRIRFGPDGALYVTTGDAGLDMLSQDEGSLNGKILRIDAMAAPRCTASVTATSRASTGSRAPTGSWPPSTATPATTR